MHENDAEDQAAAAPAAQDHGESAAEPVRRGGSTLGILPRGAPDHPLLEAAVLLAAQYLTAYLPADSAAIGAALTKPSFYLFSLCGTLPSALLVLYIMATTDGLAAFGAGRLGKASLYRGAALAAAALGAMFALGYVLGLLGIRNPIWPDGGAASLALIPLMLAASAATGYCEELYFRAFLLRRLSQAGLRPAPAIAASALVFSAAHGAQGIAGFLTAGAIGLGFAWRFTRGKDVHEVAIAHAAYNAAVFFVALYS
jgi:membrane protease YdiL (CAAX protease family)